MAGVNKVIILGNLTRDPETSYTQSGMAICKFSIATSKKKKDGTEVTSFHRCTAFQKQAELINQYVTKGQQLYVDGELSYGQYDKDGVTHYTTDIIVNQFTFIGSKKQPQQQSQGFQNQGFQGGQG
jgi:single-strand DNA-binding protein